MSKIGTDIRKAAKILSEGGLVAIPTETVYGLAANAFNGDAVTNIFEAKDRPFFDPLIIHISDVSFLNELASEVPDKAMALATKFWPGPLTLVLPKSNKIIDVVNSGLESAAFRIPNHPIAKSLLESLDFPIVAPSANPFKYISPTTAQHVEEQLGDKVDYILDGGPCSIGVESTIITLKYKHPIILRLGGVSTEDIEKIIGKVEVHKWASKKPEAPGMLTTHYSPNVELKVGKIEILIDENSGKKIGIISFKKPFPNYINSVLAPSGNLSEAAQNLFKSLRWMDNQQVEVIITEHVPNHGLGRAINDRLNRASCLPAGTASK